jgi:hypothetical protein
MKLQLQKRYSLIMLLGCLSTTILAQDVTITINAAVGKKAVSPYIYGRNNTFDKPAQFYKDAGLRFSRNNQGNNATKYNWRKKISSHPDWYNNVYANDWDQAAKDNSTTYPDMQQMYAFQLIGRVASSTSYNFDDWSYNQSQYWFGVGQNLAGGGVANTTNATRASQAVKDGDINLYTQEWPADSTVAILDHWFGAGGLGLNKTQFLYWNMDNEPDVWNGTHDDVMKTLIASSKFMDRYIETAKKARALFPEIKICGPVTTSEWQWFKWSNESITINGKYYCWLEYFIKRCAEEEKASGIRVLDVVDLHNYPWAKNGDVDAVQLHRMYYDTNYEYAGANGLYTMNGGWDTKLNKEYIFKRINDWLTQYYGPESGITCAISEWSPASSESNPSVTSVVYASHLGTFANNGVAYFTPWTWYDGMWETLHLFSRYAKGYSVSSASSIENIVSAYTTVNRTTDSMTVMIVNRDMNAARTVTVNLNGCAVADGSYTTLQLSSLPSIETFKSHTENALKQNSVAVNSNSFSITVPSLSTTAVILKSIPTGLKNQTGIGSSPAVFALSQNYPNPFNPSTVIAYSIAAASNVTLKVCDLLGREVAVLVNGQMPAGNYTANFDASHLSSGLYFYSMKAGHFTATKKLLLTK